MRIVEVVSFDAKYEYAMQLVEIFEGNDYMVSVDSGIAKTHVKVFQEVKGEENED